MKMSNRKVSAIISMIMSRRKFFIALDLVCLMTLSLSLSSTLASPESVTAMQEIELPLNFKIKVSYSWETTLSLAERTVQPGRSTTETVQVSGGRVSLSFYIPSPIDRWFDAGPFDYPIGSKQSFDIYTGVPGVSVQVVLRNTVETTPSLSGPASISPSELTWDNVGSKTLTISVSSNAKDGEKVNLSLPLQVGITADIKATVLGLLSLDLASFHLPRIQASPILTDELTVAIPFNPLPYIIGGAAIVVIVVIVAAILIRRK